MMLQLRRDRQATMVVWAALAMSASAVPVSADSVILGASDEGTRVMNPDSPAALDHGPLQLLNVLVDGRDQRSVDSDVEFNISSFTKLAHSAVVQSATLSLDIAGAQTLASPASVSVNGYGDGDGIVGLGDFVKPTTLLGITGTLSDAVAGSEEVPFRFDVTSFLQSLANLGTPAVGFHLEGPSGDSSAWVWGNAASDSADRPSLEVTFAAASVPEPASALLIGLGIMGALVLA
jgi:hypothetical protein